MRDILTYLAGFLLLILAAALAVPPFVDWSAYQDQLNARLGAVLDADVRVKGPVSVRLLPSPRFELGGVSVARPGLDLRSDDATLELALAPLLRGTLSVSSARFDRPQITLDTRANAPNGSALPVTLGIDKLALRDAVFTLRTDRATRRLDHVYLTAAVDGGLGPVKADGFVRIDNRLLPFRLATGALGDDRRLAFKAEADPLPGLPRVEAAGAFSWSDDGPRFEGVVTLSGEWQGAGRDGASAPWRVRVDGAASASGVEARALEARAGADRAAISATGTGRFDERGLALALTSERPDFDRFLAAYDPARIVQSSPPLSQPFVADWTVGTAVLGGEVVSNVRLAARRASADVSEPVTIEAGAALGADSALSFRGNVGPIARAAGRLSLRTADAPALLRWTGQLLPSQVAIPAVPVGRAELDADIAWAGERIDVTDMRATLDRSRLAGRVRFMTPRDLTPAKVEADLQADALDLDALPDLSNLRDVARNVDFALRLDARAIRVGRVGRAPVAAGTIGLTVGRTGPNLRLDRLVLEDIGGATLRATGALGPTDATFDGKVDARQLATLADLARRVAPSPLSDIFAARAVTLAPAELNVSLAGRALPDGAYALSRATIAGKMADTQVRAQVTRQSASSDALEGTVVLAAPDAAPFLRQIGLPVLPLRGQGGAKVEARLAGADPGPFTLTATATVADATANLDGMAVLSGETIGVDGALDMHARSLAPLLRIFAAPVDTLQAWPLDATAQLKIGAGQFALSQIKGQVANRQVSGSLSREGSSPFRGAFRCDTLDLPTLAALLLGAPQPASPNARFSALRFGTQPNDLPSAEINLALDRLGVGASSDATDVSATLSVGPGQIDAANVTATFAGGRVAGRAALRRQSETASFTTSLQATGVTLTLPWMSGRTSGRLDIAGAGVSPATLISSLAGSGTVQLGGGTIARADPDAPGRVARIVGSEDIDLDPAAIGVALGRAFDAGPLRFGALDQPVTIAAGQAIVAPFRATVDSGQASVEGRYDVAKNTIELRATLLPKTPPDWDGLPPPVFVNFAGPARAPTRTIDAADLIGVFAARGIAREEARIAAIDADRRERAFFNRRLRYERAEDAERKAEEARVELERRLTEARLEAERREQFRLDAARQAEAVRLEALRLDRERRAAEQARQPAGTTPLDLRPPPAAGRGSGASTIIAPDPSSLGRY